MPAMSRLALIGLFCIGISASALAQMPVAPDAAAFQQTMANKDTIAALQKGGFVLYMRHGNTDNSKPDRVPNVDLDDCNTQRPLTAAGKQAATKVGEAIRQARIPIGEVFSSPLCRAKESAIAAYGKDIRVVIDLMYTANLTSEQKKPIVAKTRQLISEPVAGSLNRVVVAHAPNLADVMGFFVTPEATVVVIQPMGNGQFKYVASIPPSLWPQLLQ